MNLCSIKGKDSEFVVALENKTGKNLVIASGAYLGVGGYGNVVNTPVGADMQKWRWRFTRITDHKQEKKGKP